VGAALLTWVLNGGWKWALGAIGAAVLGFFVISWFSAYNDMKAKAALVPGLEATITARDAVIGAMKQADADRAAADKRLSDWQHSKDQILAAIRKGMSNAPVHTNPICAPTDDDRRVRNEALDKLLAVPAPAVPAH
jgi:hypothetical protein